MFLVLGLGNPGEQYRLTRHNLGFRVVETLVDRFNGRYLPAHPLYREAEVWFGDAPVRLLKPMTYMNLSGDALSAWMTEHAAELSGLLVVSDDLALPLGNIRLRRAGSSGGHNGLQSIIETLGTEEFPRLRMGIGPVEEPVVDFVLSSFRPDEIPTVDSMIQRAADAVNDVITEDITRAMNRHNC